MLYSIDYCKEQIYIEDCDEIYIYFNLEDKTLPDFLSQQKEKNKKVVIEIDIIDLKNNYKFISALYKKYPFTLVIKNAYPEYKEIISINSENVPYLLFESARTGEELQKFLELGVSEVRISGCLAYSIVNVKKYLEESYPTVKIRMCPNVAQNIHSMIYETNINSFFIRPEDIYLYEDVIDILEFPKRTGRGEVFLDIYKNQRKWFGYLSEIILDLKSDVNNIGLPPEFGAFRLKCGGKCKSLVPTSCQICNKFEELSSTLIENNLYFKTKEKENG